MSSFSQRISAELAKEILLQVKQIGKVNFCESYADGHWGVSIDQDKVLLSGYASEFLTESLVKSGCKIIHRLNYDQESSFENPPKVLSLLHMSSLAKIYEQSEHELVKKTKLKIKK